MTPPNVGLFDHDLCAFLAPLHIQLLLNFRCQAYLYLSKILWDSIFYRTFVETFIVESIFYKYESRSFCFCFITIFFCSVILIRSITYYSHQFKKLNLSKKERIRRILNDYLITVFEENCFKSSKTIALLY